MISTNLQGGKSVQESTAANAVLDQPTPEVIPEVLKETIEEVVVDPRVLRVLERYTFRDLDDCA